MTSSAETTHEVQTADTQGDLFPGSQTDAEARFKPTPLFAGWNAPPKRISVLTRQAKELLSELRFLWRLAAAEGRDYVNPGYEYLAKKLGLGRTRTSAYIGELAGAGFVVVERHGNRTNSYSPGPRLTGVVQPVVQGVVQLVVQSGPESEQQTERQAEQQTEHHGRGAPLDGIELTSSLSKGSNATPPEATRKVSENGDENAPATLAALWLSCLARAPHRDELAQDVGASLGELVRQGVSPTAVRAEILDARRRRTEKLWDLEKRLLPTGGTRNVATSTGSKRGRRFEG